MKSDETYLRHILEMVRRMEENTSQGRPAFIASHTLQDAIFRNLQTMAETTHGSPRNSKRLALMSNGRG